MLSLVKYLIVIISLIIVGCAPLTELEAERRDYNRVIDIENWQMCESTLKYYGRPTIHKNHMHRPKGRIDPWMLGQDLSDHNCKMILKDRWADHWTKDKEEKKVLKSPMPELDSVDDVLLTPEEEARAIEEARKTEKITKPPSRPKD